MTYYVATTVKLVELEPRKGAHITIVRREAQVTADAYGCEVRFTFNGVPYSILPGESQPLRLVGGE